MSSSRVQILLFRHAHAAKALPDQADFDRPLDERGRREAAEMGAMAGNLGLSPKLALCSPARRTRETLDLSGFLASSVTVQHPELLYPGSTAQYFQALQDAASNGSVMLIGHNPGIAEAASLLAGLGDSQALAALAKGFPPAGLAAIEFDGSIAEGHGRLLHFLLPKR